MLKEWCYSWRTCGELFVKKGIGRTGSLGSNSDQPSIVQKSVKSATVAMRLWRYPNIDFNFASVFQVPTSGSNSPRSLTRDTGDFWILPPALDGPPEQEVRTGKCRHVMLGGGRVKTQPVLKHIFFEWCFWPRTPSTMPDMTHFGLQITH